MRRNVIRKVIHTNSISFISNNILIYIYIYNVVLTENTASDTVPTVLVSCGIYSYGFRVMGTYCIFVHHTCYISDKEGGS